MPETRTKKWLTVQEILDELQIAPRTWQRWRDTGRAPKCTRLPNGSLRISRDDYEHWLASLAESGDAA